MIAPRRLQLSRAAGFNLQRHSHDTNGLAAVKCDRSTQFGNPWVVGAPIDMKVARRWGWNISPRGRSHVCATAEEAVERFRNALIWDGAIHGFVRERLAGKNLACWCDLGDAMPCHCTPLLFVAASTPETIGEIHERVDAALHRFAATIVDGAAP